MSGGAHAAAHAAAEAKRRRNLEEEVMTGYSAEQLNEGWEFKIVRSATSAFRKPEVLMRVLERESLGGWELVEKFDDGRLRLKRPVAARRNDATLPRGYNAYRTRYGVGEGGLAAWITLGILAAIGVVMGIVYLTTGSL